MNQTTADVGGGRSGRTRVVASGRSTFAKARLGRALTHLRDADPVLARIIDERPDFEPRAWLRELPRMDLFGALVFQVVGQQLSAQSTRRIVERIQAQCNGQLPSPSHLLSVEPDDLRAAGLSRRKIATLRDLAQRFADGRLDKNHLSSLPDDEIEAQLTQIPGIGPWTVHGALIIALDREDVVLPGDLALRKVIERTYGLDHVPSSDEVLAIAEPWRPYRTLATSYLFASAFEPVRA
jgi:DNA-3-methyladenine glycosylase II